MGWRLTPFPGLPLAPAAVRIEMWFSRERYCAFARDTFTEHPIRHTRADGTTAEAKVIRAECRAPKDGEAHLIPEHMRRKVLGGRSDDAGDTFGSP